MLDLKVLIDARMAGLRAELAALEAAVGQTGQVAARGTDAATVLGQVLAENVQRIPRRRRGAPLADQPERLAFLKTILADGPKRLAELRIPLGMSYSPALAFILAAAATDQAIEVHGDGRGRLVGLQGQDFSAAYSEDAGEKPGPRAGKVAETRAILAESGPITALEFARRAKLGAEGGRYRLTRAVSAGGVKRTGSLYHLAEVEVPAAFEGHPSAVTATLDVCDVLREAGPLLLPDIAGRLGLSVEGARARVTKAKARGLVFQDKRGGVFYLEGQVVARAPGDDASKPPRAKPRPTPKTVRLVKGTPDEDRDALARRKIMEHLAVGDFTTAELADKIRRTSSETTTLILELRQAGKVRRASGLAWRSAFQPSEAGAEVTH